VTIEIETIHWL